MERVKCKRLSVSGYLGSFTFMRKVSGLRQYCIIPRQLPIDTKNYFTCPVTCMMKEQCKVEKM